MTADRAAFDVESTCDDTEQLRRGRPPADPVRLDVARARAERALFRDAEPARVGRYLIVEVIAAGGMGVVYRARDPRLEREVALKVTHARVADADQRRARLIDEARALARLTHPNVVSVHDVVELDGQVVVVMELIEGCTLDVWQAASPRTWREIAAVYAAAGRGLAAAHQLGLVHRDFKPTNVIVGDDGRVRVVDFGLARAVAADASVAADATTRDGETASTRASLGPRSVWTAAGVVVGTPLYMAPEQLEGRASAAAADQFSFCVALYHALYGVRPFVGDSVEQLLSAIRAGRRAPPPSLRRVPGWLRALLLRGLEPAPTDRHPSMARLLAELDRERGGPRRRLKIAAAVMATVVAAMAVVQPADGQAACDAGEGGYWPLVQSMQESDHDRGDDSWLGYRRRSCRMTRSDRSIRPCRGEVDAW